MTEQSSRDLVQEMRWQVDRIRSKQAENAELLGKLEATKEQLSALEARVSSPDGHVTVVAGSGGIVRSVELTDSAMGSNASTLSATINATIESAIAAATSKQLDIVRTQVGQDVEPVSVLGPQAKFADFGERAGEHPDEVGDGRRAATPPHEEEPASESDRFLRKLGLPDS